MTSLKRTRIPTHVTFKEEAEIRSGDKENITEVNRTSNYRKRSIIHSITDVNTKINLEVPQRTRIFSDTALLPPEKKIKFAAYRPKKDGSPKSSRPPLVGWSGNVTRTTAVRTKLPDSKDIHISKTKTYRSKFSYVTEAKKSKGKSSERSEKSSATQEQFHVNRQHITVRRNLTPHPKTIINIDDDSDSDEIFVDASAHYITYTSPQISHQNSSKKKIVIDPLNEARKFSPIRPNVYTSKSAVICQGIPEDVNRPAKKRSLSQKAQTMNTRQIKANLYSLDIYSTEYLEDIVCYQLKYDWKFVLKHHILKFHNPYEHIRAAVVNWLIQAHDYLDQSPSVLFATIRLFDFVLSSAPVPGNMHQLVGFATMWIIAKYDDTVNALLASKMVALCNNAYSVRQFLKMEKKLLTFFKFDMNIPDVSLYAMFYIKNLKTESDLLPHVVHYILECYALNMDFSTVTPSVQAAAAVCLALDILYPATNIWQTIKNVAGYYDKQDLDDTMQKMLEQIQKVQDPNYAYRQPYKKYATAEKIQASIVLLSQLVAT